MKVLLDTSVLVASALSSHPNHKECFGWVKSIVDKEIEGVVAAHTLAEMYSVLTTLPVYPPISPSDAKAIISNNVLNHFEVISLNKEDYEEVISHLAANGIIGGTTYDAIIVKAALKANVDWIVTLNEKDFRRVYPELASKVIPAKRKP